MVLFNISMTFQSEQHLFSASLADHAPVILPVPGGEGAPGSLAGTGKLAYMKPPCLTAGAAPALRGLVAWAGVFLRLLTLADEPPDYLQEHRLLNRALQRAQVPRGLLSIVPCGPTDRTEVSPRHRRDGKTDLQLPPKKEPTPPRPLPLPRAEALKSQLRSGVPYLSHSGVYIQRLASKALVPQQHLSNRFYPWIFRSTQSPLFQMCGD